MTSVRWHLDSELSVESLINIKKTIYFGPVKLNGVP